MKGNLVITIGRQCGSGGKTIGQKVAEKLGVKCYDKELLTLAAKNSGLCEELFETHDEKPTSSFLYSLVMDTYSMGYSGSTYNDMPINHKIFLAQFDAIKKIANEGPCILVGRCADYALEGYPNLLSVFIHADLDARIKRIAKKYDYYTDKRWGDADSYDVCLDSSVLGLEGTAEAIIKLIEVKEKGIKRNIWQCDE